ncbi:TetR/AcrR family transcriptional regulator [Meridianimarinicoccus roseus]|jgi:AcrR family transcriptional regulator|uniref:TetR/AcrR family transcriptional regulator n=1 Tax=Meridianimarinicoccus roseus TaxID=2072018 RepID=A0A2V2LPV0_9RHOB|nr:TetR family transcriptional regulator [Meridianimarinicoccus roseus]PWR04249.1 TetR/AcrR family transcriptional regulator [Meridianimarinicoccus roseus]
MQRGLSPIRKDRKRNPEITRAAILQAALEEFSDVGLSGARVDKIAERAGVSKPMIYDYFGDKNAVYAAALREAYIQIRRGETALDLDTRAPDDAIRALVSFTMNHFWRNPWFINMLNTENLLGGDTVRSLDDASEIQSVLLDRVQEILERGRRSGIFRSDIGAVDLYILIASVCWFPISNMHTLRVVFRAPIDEAWLKAHTERAARMILAHLKEA